MDIEDSDNVSDEELTLISHLPLYPSADEERSLWRRYYRLRRLDEILDQELNSDKELEPRRVCFAIAEDIAKSSELVRMLRKLSGLDELVDEWSTLASKNEVVVTVERLVSTAFIREHSALVKVPGYRVNSVSVVALGAHPSLMLGWHSIKEFESYGQDFGFLTKHREAAKNPKALDAWIKEWVLDCPSHEDYLRKLGYDRIQALKSYSKEDTWDSRLPSVLKKFLQVLNVMIEKQ
ncbi:hypothetical protein ACFLWI_05895 [Chloroflexota bacterium]